jgi:hypothetical protein
MKRSLLLTTLCLTALCTAITSNIHAQTGPGGVGAVDGSSGLELWIRGDTSELFVSASAHATATGDAVVEWRDRSGNGRHAIASSSPTDRRPLLRAGTDGLNGHPVLRFDGTNDFFRTASISPALTQPFTLFTLSRKIGTATTALNVVDSRTSGTNTMTQGYWTNTTQARINAGSNLTLAITQTDFTILRGIFDGTSSSLAANGGTPATGSVGTRAVDGFTVGASRNSDGFLNGEIAEVIAYSGVLNTAERRIVENYLSARYGIAITGDLHASTTYLSDLIGIGRDGGGTHTSSRAAGLLLGDDGFLVDDGDFVLAAHDGAENGETTYDIPSDVTARWDRIWYVEKSAAGTGSGDITLGFDLDEGGFTTSSGDPSNYALLYRNGASGNFAAVTASATMVGDSILFDLPESSLSTGYYTLGSHGAGDASLPVEISSFTLSLDEGHVRVAWATASERQNAGFLLSRSVGESGPAVAIASHLSHPALLGAGTSSTRVEYSFLDPDLLPSGVYHYHLEQIDIDGNRGENALHRSITIEAAPEIPQRDALEQLLPNPAFASALVRYAVREAGPVCFTLRDRLGEDISRTVVELAPGRSSYTLDLSLLRPGLYFLTMQTGRFMRTRPIVVAR